MGKIDIDSVLKNALETPDAPSHELNCQTIMMMRERAQMRHKTKLPMRLAAVLAAVLTLSSVAVFAAVKYLTPREAVTRLGDAKLAEAFESEDSLFINETVSSGGYDITLLGIVSGRNLSSYTNDANVEKMYAIVAIEKPGFVMPDTSSDEYGKEDFFISPLIKGCPPWRVNIFTMENGSSSTFVLDGVMYRLIECGSVEMFADVGVYIGISNNNDVFCNNESFVFDAETGEIKPNAGNGFVSVVFDLPLDKSKADPVRAAEFLESHDAVYSVPESDTSIDNEEQEGQEWQLEVELIAN